MTQAHRTRLTGEGLARFGEIAAGHVAADVADGGVPGLVALVGTGEEAHVEAHGALAIGGALVRRDSQFRISATTKPITGALTLALVREGLLTLDEPVDRLLPELADRRVLRRMDGPLDETVPAARPITVRDLLTFTFGFGTMLEMFDAEEDWPVDVAESGLPTATLGPPNPARLPDPDAWLAALGSLPLITQPGERWAYNTSAQVLGALASRATGQPIAEAYRTRLLEPLEMRDTGFFAADTTRLATAYKDGPDGGLEVSDPPAGQWSKPPAFGDGGGGLVSTVDDLWRFARMLLRGGDPVLTPDAVAAMTSNQLTPAQQRYPGPGDWWPGPSARFRQRRTWGFCLSVITEGRFAGCYGWDGGMGTTWLVDPARDLVVVVLTQRSFGGPDAVPAVHADLQEAAFAALADPALRRADGHRASTR
jgi:CubicO group peptidase (beta-lactamase class C family)